MITAGSPLPSVMLAVRRSGAGPLADRGAAGLVAVLDGLTAVLPWRSAEGWTTVPQVADAALRSERWTRRCLAVLEDAGLIRWVRGGIVDGKPAPSWIRVSKAALVALIAKSRPALEAVRAARARATAARIAAAARVSRPGTYRRRSVHAEVSATPNPPKGGSAPHALPTSSSTTQSTEQVFDMQGTWVVATCQHGGEAGTLRLADGTEVPRCPDCRRVARWLAEPTVPAGLADR